MSAELAKTAYPVPPLPLIVHGDARSVAPTELVAYIDGLERACRSYRHTSHLRLCIALAQAVNGDICGPLAAVVSSSSTPRWDVPAPVERGLWQIPIRRTTVASNEHMDGCNVARQADREARDWRALPILLLSVAVAVALAFLFVATGGT